ncbi:transcriptional repressor general negative regulator of transcription subunit 4 [Ascosphaera acerosa]|nr:transcriptional repressor general negative regulator of transcription subunit 4 [Ascosphaera acerosa]
MFTARTAKYDKQRIYDTFRSPESHIRVVAVTTALGMGMDLPDVEVVVQWGMPPTKSVADSHQQQPSRKRKRNTMRHGGVNITSTPASQVLQQPTPLTQSLLLINAAMAIDADDDALETASIASDLSLPSNLSEDQAAGVAGTQKEEMEARQVWHAILTSACLRVAVLATLQETPGVAAARQTCCSRCDKALTPVTAVSVPVPPKPVKAPGPPTRAGIAYKKTRGWCEERGGELRLLGGKELSVVPSDLFMVADDQFRLARLFNKSNMRDRGPIRGGLGVLTQAQLANVINPKAWRYWKTHASRLIEFLHDVQEDVVIAAERRAPAAAAPEAAAPATPLSSSMVRRPSLMSSVTFTPLAELADLPETPSAKPQAGRERRRRTASQKQADQPRQDNYRMFDPFKLSHPMLAIASTAMAAQMTIGEVASHLSCPIFTAIIIIIIIIIAAMPSSSKSSPSKTFGSPHRTILTPDRERQFSSPRFRSLGLKLRFKLSGSRASGAAAPGPACHAPGPATPCPPRADAAARRRAVCDSLQQEEEDGDVAMRDDDDEEDEEDKEVEEKDEEDEADEDEDWVPGVESEREEESDEEMGEFEEEEEEEEEDEAQSPPPQPPLLPVMV